MADITRPPKEAHHADDEADNGRLPCGERRNRRLGQYGRGRQIPLTVTGNGF